MAKPKAIIQISGSVLQAQTVGWALEAGLTLLLTDSNDQAPMRAKAAEFACIDGTDIPSLKAQAQVWAKDYDIIGVNCGGDFGLVSASEVASSLSLPHIPKEVVERALDKPAALTCFQKAGVTTPHAVSLPPLANDFPLIVKPADSSGSRGVSYVDDPADFDLAMETARQFSDETLVERHVDGQHIDINAIFWHGNFLPGELIERFFSPYPARYGTKMVTPPTSLPAGMKQKIWAEFEKAARSLGIDHGPVKGDLIVSDEAVCVLEVAPRFHGETNTFALPHAYGTCTAALYMQSMATGEMPDTSPLAKPKQVAGWLGIFPPQPGIFRGLDGMDAARAIPGIKQILVRRPVGSTIQTVRDNTAVIGFIYGAATDHKTLDSRLAAALAALHIQMDPLA